MSAARRSTRGSVIPALYPRNGGEYGVQQTARAETDRVVGRQTGVLFGRCDGLPRFLLPQRGRVQRDGGDLRRPSGKRQAFVELDELAKRRNRMPWAPLDLICAGGMAEHEEVRRAAVVEAERHAGELRMNDRSLTLDPQELATLRAFEDEPLRRTGQEVRHDRVDGDPPAGDHDSRLAGRDEHRAKPAAPRLEIELER